MLTARVPSPLPYPFKPMNKLMPIGASFAKTALPAFLLAAGLALGGQPAHAQEFGSADWEDGTSDFIDDATDAIDGTSNSFSVTFSPATPPAILGGLASSASEGELNAYFGTPPIGLFPVVPYTSTFTRLGDGPVADSAVFAVDDIVFDITTPGGNVVFDFIESGPNEWAGIIEADDAVAFNDISGEWEVKFITGALAGTTRISSSSEFEFGQPDGASTGNYSGALAYSKVPGPLPLMGAGVAFGYSRKLRRRIKSSVSA